MAYNWKRLSHFWIQMLDLNDIVVFARVVEAGSFTAAARLLGMPKTTVSRRIAALEREVGVRLVQRTTRSLNMTDAGRLYYEQSSQALRTIEDANLRLAEARAEPSGTIRISAPVGFGGHFLTSAVFDFLAAYPKTKVELHLTDDTLNLVGNRIDLAFRTGILPDSTLIARKLGSTHRILCASPDYVARRGVPVASADLARHHCVIAGPSIGSAHWALDGPRGQETVAVSGRFAANEMQAVDCRLRHRSIALPGRRGVCQGRAVAPRSRRLHDAGWRALCRVSEQPTRFAFGQGIHRACRRAIGRHRDRRG